MDASVKRSRTSSNKLSLLMICQRTDIGTQVDPACIKHNPILRCHYHNCYFPAFDWTTEIEFFRQEFMLVEGEFNVLKDIFVFDSGLYMRNVHGKKLHDVCLKFFNSPLGPQVDP